ncbi:MAG: ABC transporter ATP-binding protein [Roseobacter sp.]
MVNRASIFTLKDVRYTWPAPTAFGLDIAFFDLAVGETVLLLGESGSGKSTLLSLICGTVAAASGHIEVAGTDITTLSPGRKDRFRAENIGLIFQQFNLLPYATVLDNIMLPLQFAPERRARVKHPKQSVTQLCLDLGLPQSMITAQAGTLSVGQQQRVAAARALIGAPPLIIADEPTSALDAGTQATFLQLLFTQCRAHNSTLLMVSHDERLAGYFDKVVHLSDVAHIRKEYA